MTYIASYCTSFGVFRVNARTNKLRVEREREMEGRGGGEGHQHGSLIKQMHFVAEADEVESRALPT